MIDNVLAEAGILVVIEDPLSKGSEYEADQPDEPEASLVS